MHDIEELKRQLEAAKGRAREATMRVHEADSRLRAAVEQREADSLASKGTPVGSIVAVFMGCWSSGTKYERVPGEFFLSGVGTTRYGALTPEIIVCPLKKDGTPSKVEKRFERYCLEFIRAYAPPDA